MNNTLQQKGFLQIPLALPSEVSLLIKNEDWTQLDSMLENMLRPNNLIYNQLSPYIQIDRTEHIISIRNEEDDEDGIWHDDGSRELAFTLGLTQEKIQGGILQFREKSQENITEIPTPEYGTLTIFLTGVHRYEHRVLKVTKGRRIICAGWIN